MTKPATSPSLARLFRELSASDVLAYVADRRGEDLTLDFKLATSAFESREDRKTLAIALSGFANGAGGLIVWGVDARPGPDGVDCAQKAEPLGNAPLFLSRLVSHAGGAVSPVVDGVEHRVVEGPGGPFALTYVPESPTGPHMAKLGEDRYYKRSGDRFVRMEHFDVADMFGRRRRPVLDLLLEKEGEGDTILVSIRNRGRAMAAAPFLALSLPREFHCSMYGFDGNGSVGLPQVGRAYERAFFGGDANRVIHVGQVLIVTKIERRDSQRPLVQGPQVFQYELAADGCDLTSGEIVLQY